MADPTTQPSPTAGDLAGLDELVEYGAVLVVVLGLAYAVTIWLTGIQARQRGRSKVTDRLIVWLPLVQIAVWIVALGLAAGLLADAPTVVLLFVLVPLIVALVVGSRDLFRNVIAGALLAFEHTILAGDVVHVATPEGEIHGEIVAIGLRRTLLQTPEGSDVFVPNQTLLNSTVQTNRSHGLDSAVEIDIPHADEFASTPLEALRERALEAASVSRFASPRRRPEAFLDADPSGRMHVRVTAYAFAPAYVRHLQSDVLGMLREELEAR